MKTMITHWVYALKLLIEVDSVPNPPVDMVVNEWLIAWKRSMSPRARRMVSATVNPTYSSHRRLAVS